MPCEKTSTNPAGETDARLYAGTMASIARNSSALNPRHSKVATFSSIWATPFQGWFRRKKAADPLAVLVNT
jgi:hypothetical protein